jgi:hypothetical protein
MPRKPSNVVRFPGSRGILLTDHEHRLLLDVIGPYYGADIEDFIASAPAEPHGRRMDPFHPAMDGLLDALGCECHGYQKLDDERQDGGEPANPGSTAVQLMAVYDRLAGQ